MEGPMMSILALGLVLVVISTAGIEKVDGQGQTNPCGNSTVEDEFAKLSPCKGASNIIEQAVPESCCTQISLAAKNPGCLCAVLRYISNKFAGVLNPDVARSIPNRCNVAISSSTC